MKLLLLSISVINQGLLNRYAFKLNYCINITARLQKETIKRIMEGFVIGFRKQQYVY